MSGTATGAVDRSRGRSPALRWRIPALTGALAVAAAVLYVAFLAQLEPPLPAPRAYWLGLALLFFLAEAIPVHIHIRSEAHTLSLSEFGLVLGLYIVSPGWLVLAHLLGAGLAMVLVRRQRPLKLAFNVAMFSLGTCLAVAVFHAFLQLGEPAGPAGWAGALLGSATNGVTGVLLVSAVVCLAGVRSVTAETVKLLGVALCCSLVTGSLAIAAVELARFDARSLWVLVIPIAVAAVALWAYAVQRRRHEHLQFLYESMRATQGASELRSSVRELLEAARTMLAADVAEIIVFPGSPEEGGLRSVASSGGELVMESIEAGGTTLDALRHVSLQDSAALLPRGRPPHPLDDLLAARGLDDAIVAALRGAEVFGLVLVGNRSGDVATFTTDDRRLFETFAGHAGVLLENDRVKEQLRHQAFHDGLTGLPNRALFSERVNATVERRAVDGRTSLVLFLDLDDFKTVNDSLGHSSGDQVLVGIAERLRATLRPHEFAARLGGDEFAILLEASERRAGDDLASRLLAAFRAPFVAEGRELAVQASIGIAGLQDAKNAEELMRNADVAMYSAKNNGKGGCAWYEPEMHLRIRRQQELAAALEHAVERDEIEVYYQPIVAVATGRLVAFEALVRWNHPARGLVLPQTFIPVAEETGLMVPIGRTVLRQACEHLTVWKSRYPSHEKLMVSVNLSQTELRDDHLVGDVEALLARSGISPDSLILEITESSAMLSPAATIETLARLRRLGVRLALDDFGTGYSSLSHLRDFPIDMLKIAKPFVDRIDLDTADGTFVDAILRLAAALDLDVVAEGIERASQAAALRNLSCALGQGYLYARPAAASEIESRLEADNIGSRSRRRVRAA
jgi:diguanylate cyclase (GGDEF)-like protein